MQVISVDGGPTLAPPMPGNRVNVPFSGLTLESSATQFTTVASRRSSRQNVRMDDTYERIGAIGKGVYGEVFKARVRETGRMVAMKKIKFEVNDEGIPATALREITILKKLQCTNVVTLDDVVHEDNKLFLVFEFLDQDLKVYIDSIGPEGMDPKIVNSFARQMLRGLTECHSRSIIHRDLKPQNLLIDKRGNLKLADFGLSRMFKTPCTKYTHEVVTLWYRAPEILLGSPHYSTSIDLWAAGCIIAEMCNLTALFQGISEIDQLFQVFKTLGTPTELTWPGFSQLPDFQPMFPKWPARNMEKIIPHISDDGLDLLKQLLLYAPSRRLTAKAAIDHPFFTRIEQPIDYEGDNNVL